MGRYSTVQAFADNNPNMRKVAYDQAAGASSIAEPGTGGKSSGKAVVPEKARSPNSWLSNDSLTKHLQYAGLLLYWRVLAGCVPYNLR